MVNFLSNVTFSTAYYDIDRGKWADYTRTTDTYFQYFNNVKQINCNLVIYCEEPNYERIKNFVSDRDNVKIIVRPFNHLDFYIKFFDKIKNLMSSEEYIKRVKQNCPTPHVPEYIYPEYNIINFNKVAFVKESFKYFDAQYHGWIDFGFGHNKDYVKYTLSSDFLEKATQNSKVFMRSFKTPQPDQLFNFKEYWHNDPAIHGSCFLGTNKSINKMYSLMENAIEISISNGCIDDDQTQYAMTYLLDPNNFNLISGNWFTHFCE